jgi:hypothetical protein
MLSERTWDKTNDWTRTFTGLNDGFGWENSPEDEYP